ncbi:hypothetical protein EDB92DRAFT_1771964, partial [Lactarius akahatsu]
LGSAEEYTVFEAELVGILLGLRAKKVIGHTPGVDNQAAIKALSSKSKLNKPGHHIAAEALNTTSRTRKTRGKRYALTIRWTAGHSGILGNEKVDSEAKKAAE